MYCLLILVNRDTGGKSNTLANSNPQFPDEQTIFPNRKMMFSR